MLKLRLKKFTGQKGYTLMEVLIVATIVGILVSVGTVQYLEVKRRAKEKFAVQKLAQLSAYENMYFREFGNYADFDNLKLEGYVDQSYYEDDEFRHYLRPAYIPEYQMEFVIDDTGGGFRITASPVLEDEYLWFPRWVALGGIQDLRSVYVEEDGVVKWLDSNRPVF
jgi:prepilin-type N-terminal cleavage/methylation domain-containing protein